MTVPVGHVMPFRRVLSGRVFVAWTVTERARQREKGRGLEWWCRCECGAERWVAAQALVERKSKSCGCKKRSPVRTGNIPEFRSWLRMRDRCSPNNKEKSKYYAERGIAIAPEWDSFEKFLADMGPVPHPGWTLDRIDNDRGYSRENCRWADCQVQAINRRQNQSRNENHWRHKQVAAA